MRVTPDHNVKSTHRREFIRLACGASLVVACRPGRDADAGRTASVLDWEPQANCGAPRGHATFKLRVLDHAGAPAHGGVKMYAVEQRDGPEVGIPADGMLELAAPTHRLVVLDVHAVDHAHFTVTLWVEHDVEVTLKLGTYAGYATIADSNPGHVTLRMVWANDNGELSEYVTVQAAIRDGIAHTRATAPKRASTLRYQLQLDDDGARWVNGTKADSLVYDGGGDYWSQLDIPQNREVDIAVRLSDLPPAGVEPVFDLQGQKLWSDATAGGRVEAAAHPMHEQLAALTGSHENGLWLESETLDVDARKQFAAIRDEFLAEPEPMERSALLAILLLEGAKNLNRIARLGEEVLPIVDALESTSPSWSLSAHTLADFFTVETEARLVAKARDIAQKHADPVAIGRAVIAVARMAEFGGRHREAVALAALLRHLGCETSHANELDKSLERTASLRVGKQAKWRFKTSGGGTKLTLPPSDGRYYLLDFWAQWCEPCIYEMPPLHHAYYAINGVAASEARSLAPVSSPRVQFVSLAAAAEADKIEEFRKTRWPMPWLHVALKPAVIKKLHDKWGIRRFPTPVLLDPSGNVLERGDTLRGPRLVHTLRRHVA